MNEDYMKYRDKGKHTILIVDDSKAIHVILSKILEEAGYKIISAFNGREASEILTKGPVDLVITDIEMPEMTGFDLIQFINEKKIPVPYFMISTLSIEQYIEMALTHNVGNILSKPFQKETILREVHKFIFKDKVFGLGNYMPPGSSNPKTIELTSSEEIQSVLQTVTDAGFAKGIPPDQICNFKVILNEMISNAIYHAHGREDLKMAQQRFDLSPGEKVTVSYASHSTRFGVCISDYKGELKKQKILETIKEIFDTEKRITEANAKGEKITTGVKYSGRGLYMTMAMANEYVINIQSGKKTEVIILLRCGDKEKPAERQKMSIRINEFS